MTSFELRELCLRRARLVGGFARRAQASFPRNNASKTQDLLDRSRLFVDTYTLTVTPHDAHVLIDGREPEFESDGTLMFGFGQHTLEVRAPGLVVRTLPIDVARW